MTAKRILGLVIVLGGIVMIFFSYYIKNRVMEGIITEASAIMCAFIILMTSLSDS